MNENTLEFMYNKFRSASKITPVYALDFFEHKAIAFYYLTMVENEKELDMYMELTWQYLHALYQRSRFEQAADMAVKHLNIIEEEKDRLHINLHQNEWYNAVLFIHAMTLYRLKKFRHSTLVFKKLLLKDPNNENYRDWLKYSRYGQRAWISKFITAICCLIILMDLFFKSNIPSNFSGMPLKTIAITGLLGTLLFDFVVAKKMAATG